MYELNGIVYAGERKPMTRVIAAEPLEDYKLKLLFSTGETKIYDFGKHLQKPVFQKLKNKKLFDTVYVDKPTICWCNGELDFDPECLYEDGILVEE